jgi:hypothetical protein
MEPCEHAGEAMLTTKEAPSGQNSRQSSLKKCPGRYGTGSIPVDSEQVGYPDGILTIRVSTARTKCT